MSESDANVDLNNGVRMPLLDFGVLQTPPDGTRSAVAEALKTFGREIPEA
jgi:hypothetical protein